MAEETTAAPPPAAATMTIAMPSTFLIRVLGATIGLSLGTMGLIAVLTLFYPPQEWQLPNTIVGNLKEVALIALSALAALATGSVAPAPKPAPPAGS